MAYPFKKVEHRIYKNTFLKDVRIAVEFPVVNTSAISIEILEKYFSQFKGAGIHAQDFLESGRINVFSNDHYIDFKFALNYAEVKISAQQYVSFEGAKPYWQMFYDFMYALRVESVSKLIVRKYNALYFKADSQTYNVKSVMEEVFCDDLMALMTDVERESSLNSIEKTQAFVDTDTDTLFSAVFGIKKSDTADKNDHLTLVTTVESNKGPVAVRDVPQSAKKYNEILFDAFHWCIKDSIIKNMEVGQ